MSIVAGLAVAGLAVARLAVAGLAKGGDRFAFRFSFIKRPLSRLGEGFSGGGFSGGGFSGGGFSGAAAPRRELVRVVFPAIVLPTMHSCVHNGLTCSLSNCFKQ